MNGRYQAQEALPSLLPFPQSSVGCHDKQALVTTATATAAGCYRHRSYSSRKELRSHLCLTIRAMNWCLPGCLVSRPKRRRLLRWLHPPCLRMPLLVPRHRMLLLRLLMPLRLLILVLLHLLVRLLTPRICLLMLQRSLPLQLMLLLSPHAMWGGAPRRRAAHS